MKSLKKIQAATVFIGVIALVGVLYFAYGYATNMSLRKGRVTIMGVIEKVPVADFSEGNFPMLGEGITFHYSVKTDRGENVFLDIKSNPSLGASNIINQIYRENIDNDFKVGNQMGKRVQITGVYTKSDTTIRLESLEDKVKVLR